MGRGGGVRPFLIALAAALLAAGCLEGAREPAPGSALAGDRMLFPADLGPDVIDVRDYPSAQQENYRLVVAKCSGCHTLARVVNSPIVDGATWSRYVSRMHGKSAARGEQLFLTNREARQVESFLVFDSRRRKVRQKEEFQALLDDLERRFERAREDRARALKARNAAQAREPAPYVGDR